MKLLAALGLALACPLACLAASETPPAAPASSASAPSPASPVRRFQSFTGIDGAGWKLNRETQSSITWTTPEGVLVTLQVRGRGADQDAWLFEQVAAQDWFRTQALNFHAALVEVQIRRSPQGTYAVATLKGKLAEMQPQQADAGLANLYIMDATFPLEGAIGSIQLFGREASPTGLREALVGVIRAMKENHGQLMAMPQHDPYDARFDAQARYVDSDARQWDSAAPGHALTRIRVLMSQLLSKSKLPGVPETVAAELAAASGASR